MTRSTRLCVFDNTAGYDVVASDSHADVPVNYVALAMLMSRSWVGSIYELVPNAFCVLGTDTPLWPVYDNADTQDVVGRERCGVSVPRVRHVLRKGDVNIDIAAPCVPPLERCRCFVQALTCVANNCTVPH